MLIAQVRIQSTPKENSLEESLVLSENPIEVAQEIQRLETETDQIVSSRPVTTTRRRQIKLTKTHEPLYTH